MISKTARKLAAGFFLSLFIFASSAISLAPAAHAAGNTMVRGLCDLFKDNAFVTLLFFTSPITTGIVDRIAGDREWYDQSPCQFYNKVFDDSNPNEIFGERYTYAQVTWIINSIGSFLMNTAFGTVTGTLNQFKQILWDAVTTDGRLHLPPLAQTPQVGGLAGLAGRSFEYLDGFQPSFFHYSLPRFLEKFDLASPASAQGYGYRNLAGIHDLWKAFRNMSYIVMIIILVAAGFMIMFRVRIGQAAVTLPMMVPKIILTLVGITFSFAIAGFVIDLTYLFLGFILYSLEATSPNVITTGAAAFSYFTDPTIGFARIWSYFSAYMTPFSLLLAFIPFGPLVFPILFVILLFKLWWAMLKNYAHLLIHIITAPFQILMGLLPGHAGFGQWLRNVMAYSAVFLVIPLLFLFVVILWSGGFAGGIINGLLSIGSLGIGGALVVPPIELNFSPDQLPNLPLFGTGGFFGGYLLQLGIGWIILALMPSITDTVVKAFKATSFGQADITGDLIAAATMARGQAGQFAQAAQRFGVPTNLQEAATRLRPSGTPPPAGPAVGSAPTLGAGPSRTTN